MTTPPWYVITGGPCAGKTTVIQALAEAGYRTVPEAARLHIEAGLERGHTLEELRADEAGFQRELIPLKLSMQEALSPDEIVFFDRGMHDSIAYLEAAGVTDDPILTDALAKSHYRAAFVLDLLPFTKDHVRTEDEATAQRIHQRLIDVYEKAGIPVVRVPVLPVAERAAFILARL